MRRLGHPSQSIALAFTLAIAGAWWAALPPAARACTCGPWGPLLTYGGDPAHAIFTGWVSRAPVGDVDLGGAQAVAFDFAVERWFAGPGPAAVVRVATVGELGCGLQLRGGEHLFTVAWRAREGAPWQPSICTPWADVDSAEGGRLLAEAALTFRPGAMPTLPANAQPVDPRAPVVLALAGAALLAVVARAVRRPDRGA